jgi:hypothetical protein
MSDAYWSQRFITKGRMTPTESKSLLKGVEGGFELDLACLVALLGEIMMSQDVCFSWLFWKMERELVLFVPAPVWNYEILPTPRGSF